MDVQKPFSRVKNYESVERRPQRCQSVCIESTTHEKAAVTVASGRASHPAWPRPACFVPVLASVPGTSASRLLGGPLVPGSERATEGAAPRQPEPGPEPELGVGTGRGARRGPPGTRGLSDHGTRALTEKSCRALNLSKSTTPGTKTINPPGTNGTEE